MDPHVVRLVLLLLLRAAVALGQTGASIPSKDEILELLSKAKEKVEIFEDAMKQVQPHLDEANPKLSKNYLDAASKAREMIRATQKNGISGYRLVGLLATLDDLSVNAATASVTLLLSKRKSQDPAVVSEVVLLMSSKNACNDIAELLMHATLRLIRAEEDVLEEMLKSKD